MLFQEAHPSSKLGDVPLKTPCIIFFDDVTSQTISKNYSKLPPTLEEHPLALEEQPAGSSHAVSRAPSLKQAWGCSSQNTMHHLFDDVTSQTISKNYSKLPPTLEELPHTLELLLT
jgi:hypothetical protein